MSLRKVLPKSDWVLTQAAFDGFLATLDNNRDKAGEKYEYIRLKLLKYFQWCGSDVPDIDADETINRVMRRIYEGPRMSITFLANRKFIKKIGITFGWLHSVAMPVGRK